MQTDSALVFGVRELAPAFASTGLFESAGSPREISMTNNKFSMPNSQFSNPRILESPLVAGEITQKLEASHVPAVARCHGCHGLPRLMPRGESGKTLDFIGLPRVPRPFTPLGVGAPFRWSKLAISQSRTPEAGNLTSATLPGIFGYVLTHHVSRITPSNT